MATPELHPLRYPKHDEQGRGLKGQLYGGECNRTRCHATGATFFNRDTRAYECPTHAACANEMLVGERVACVWVEGQLTREEMDKV